MLYYSLSYSVVEMEGDGEVNTVSQFLVWGLGSYRAGVYQLPCIYGSQVPGCVCYLSIQSTPLGMGKANGGRALSPIHPFGKLEKEGFLGEDDIWGNYEDLPQLP